MKKNKLNLLIIFSILNGCSSYRIYEDKIKVDDGKSTTTQESSKGIPFFTHKEVLQQKTLITRNWLDITFTLQVFENNILKPKQSKTFNIKGKIIPNYSEKLFQISKIIVNSMNSDSIYNISNLVIKEMATVGMYLNENDFFIDSSSTNPDPNNLIESIISNTFETVATVDYSTKYYFNTRIYPFSTNDSTITISDKGTLTEASNNIDTTGLAEVIPLNDFLLDKLSIGVGEDPTPIAGANKIMQRQNINQNIPKIEYKLIFITKIDGFKYELIKTINNANSIPNNPLTIGDKGISVIRSKIGQMAQKPDKPKDDKSFIINGSITPPKS